MRFLSLLFLTVLSLVPSVVFAEGGYELSGNCETCHKEIVQQWKGSAHGMAHFSRDEFFGKVVKAVAQKTQKEIGAVQDGCLSCHAQRVEGPLAEDIALEGVGCSLCHRISGIEHAGKGSSPSGGTLLWLSEGQFAGPSSESKAPHGTVQSDLFAGDADKLC
ncbi:MAG: multiheme c-type cytochrome, partial [Thermodesulfovibrionales bacterium]